MTASLMLMGSVAAATVLGTAGIGKLRDEREFHWRLAGAGEIALAAALFIPPIRSAALVVTVAAATGFVAAAARGGERPCRCFGARLRAFSRRMRLARAGALLFVAGVGLAASLYKPAAETEFMATSIVVGLAVGALIVFVPTAVSSLATGAGGIVKKEDLYG